MEFQQLLQFCIDNKEWIAISLTGLLTGLFENRRAARKTKSEAEHKERETYLKERNLFLEQSVVNFKQQESLRAELRQHNQDLKEHIHASDKKLAESGKKIAEIENKSDIIETTLTQVQIYNNTHKFEQRSDLKDLRDLNDEGITDSRVLVANLDNQDIEQSKKLVEELVLKYANMGDEKAVLISRIWDRNEAFNDFSIPTSSDILV